MNILSQILVWFHEFWGYLIAAIPILISWIFKEKIGDILKVIFSWFFKDHTAALEAHEAKEKIELDDLRGRVSDSEIRVIEAMKENFSIIREDFRAKEQRDIAYQNKTDDRFERFEKMHQDLLFRYLDKKDKAS